MPTCMRAYNNHNKNESEKNNSAFRWNNSLVLINELSRFSVVCELPTNFSSVKYNFCVLPSPFHMC